MKLAILSRASNCYSTRRLKEAASKRGHKAKVLDTLRFSIDLEKGEPDLYYRSKPLSDYDAIVPRIGASCRVLRLRPPGAALCHSGRRLVPTEDRPGPP